MTNTQFCSIQLKNTYHNGFGAVVPLEVSEKSIWSFYSHNKIVDTKMLQMEFYCNVIKAKENTDLFVYFFLLNDPSFSTWMKLLRKNIREPLF